MGTRRVGGNAGVVYHDIDSPIVRRDLLPDVVDRSLVANVDLEGLGLAARLLDQRGGFVGACKVLVGTNYGRAERREP